MPNQCTSVSFRQTGRFSELFCDYAENLKELHFFHAGFPDKYGLEKAIRNRELQFPPEIRKLLHRQLSSQTRQTPFHQKQEDNLNLLASETCFTVSCGHQLCIGGGPQYMLFKILSVIRLAENLTQSYPQRQFVPVFWLAGEDHDLEEIQQLRFFGNDYRIEVCCEGPCGRIRTDGISKQLRAIPEFPEAMINAYDHTLTLSQATRYWLQHYFGEHGLLVLDADDKKLKQSFLPEMLAELESPVLADTIRLQTRKLESQGYDAQLHCRDLNLFYMEDGLRQRLEKSGNCIHTSDHRKEWQLGEAISYFSGNPEKLSPNACLRPLYSQKILPDIAFVGGPAEIAYWLQLKSAFELREVFFPVLVPRFSGLILPQNRNERLGKLGLAPSDLFSPASELRKKIALGDDAIPKTNFRSTFNELFSIAKKTDPGLVASLEADLRKMEELSEQMEKKVRKAAEKKAETQISQLTNLLEFCFPGGNMLERSESWLSSLTQDTDFPDWLLKEINPVTSCFSILTRNRNH